MPSIAKLFPIATKSLLCICLILSTYLNPSQVLGQSFHKRDSGNEIHEIRIYESAPPGTKATLNENLDRALREQKNCFAQLETTDPDLDWIEFDSALLVFMTTTKVPSTAKTTQQAVLHLMCSSNKMRSIHFSIHVTRRNRHPPKFSSDQYNFYAPANLLPGLEVGRVHVVDHDPIIYNSQIQLTIVRQPPASAINSALAISRGQSQSPAEIDAHWQVFKNGSVNVARLMTDLQLYRPYTIKLLAVDFGSPQLFSTANVTIVPVSVSQPTNLRVNVANTGYQIFEWDSPSFGIPEKYRLSISKQDKVMYTQEVDAGENIVMSKTHFQPGPEYSVVITAVDVEGESPSQPHTFVLISTELQCDGECSPRGGVPMCFYGKFHKIEQYRDMNGLHCLCYDGYSSAQCDTVESCVGERSIESYGGVDWPFTPVNQSSSILCPYNSNGEMLKRQCVWDRRLNVAKWENVSSNELCKKQSSILVHLGVLANFAQRNDQTVSGLRAVQRFLDTVLQFPSFNPNVSTAHFDSKIAEHVAQVIDGMATRNLTMITGGNATGIRNHLNGYIKEFTRRLPVPFDLRSLGEGFQLKTWYWAGGEDDRIGGPGKEEDEGNLPVQLGRRCYIHLPSKAKSDHSSAIQGNSEVVRVGCLKSSTLFPLLDGKSPVLFVNIEEDEDFVPPMTTNVEEQKGDTGLKKRATKALPEGAKALIGLRPELSTAMISGVQPAVNYTCAYYDEIAHAWSITGVTVLSRNFENGFILCETTHLSVFALLPESMFTTKQLTSLESVAMILPICTAFVAIVCTIFLLLVAAFQRSRYTDPALVVFLLTILLVHVTHLMVLIAPHFSTNALKGWDAQVYLVLQYALISVAMLMALLNSSIHSRIAEIELDTPKVFSRLQRCMKVLTLAIATPVCFCIATWLLDGYVLHGLTSRNPTLLPFKWTFTLTFLLPLVMCIGSAIGYGCYSLYYGNALAKQQCQTSAVLLTGGDGSKRTTLLRDLANAAGISLLVLLMFYSSSLVFYQRLNVTRSLVLALLHIGVSLAVFLFAGYLYRIEARFPRFSRHFNVIDVSRNGGSNGGGAFTATNTDVYEEPIHKSNHGPNGTVPSTFKANGYQNPQHTHPINSPSGSDGLTDPNLDRKILLGQGHNHQPFMLAMNERTNPTNGGTLQLRARNNSVMGDHILSRHSFLAYKDGLPADYGTSLRRCSQPVVSAGANDYYGILSARHYSVVPRGLNHSAPVETNGYKTSAVMKQDTLAARTAHLLNSTGRGSVLESDDLNSHQSSPATNTSSAGTANEQISPLKSSLMQKFLNRGLSEEEPKAILRNEPPPPCPLPNTRILRAKFADEEDDLEEESNGGDIIREEDEEEEEQQMISKNLFAKSQKERRGSMASVSSSSEMSHPLVSVV